jgi:hypothetical protein
MRRKHMSVDNIVKIYNLATPAEMRDGVVWYANALADCLWTARETEVPLHIVVGVCAALSPNNRWERNTNDTLELVRAFVRGDDMDSVKVSTYNAMKRKAWTILEEMPDHDGVIDILNGQKIVAFYRNIMGEDTCTVDGHAKNIYYGERHGLTSGKTNVGRKEYIEIQQAYVEAGKKCKYNGRPLKAFEIQAITWVTWRRIHGIA